MQADVGRRRHYGNVVHHRDGARARVRDGASRSRSRRQCRCDGTGLSQVEAAFAAAPGFSERLLPVAFDVTDESQAVAAVEAAIARFGSIDVLVNNAGRGLLGAVEEASAAEVEAVFATNVFGLGPVIWRLVTGRCPLTEDDADAIVDSVLNGLRTTTLRVHR